MPPPPDAADEIKRLYFAATKATIADDVERAIAVLISLESDEARERVAVYMDGLAQMRSEWGVKASADLPKGRTRPATTTPRRSAGTTRSR
ncbi:MAG: hypothetical protein ABI880_07995 [Acidobacteriota bacterium]